MTRHRRLRARFWLPCAVVAPIFVSLVFAQGPRPVGKPKSVVANDASRLNQTSVAEIWDVPADAPKAEAQLQELLGRARREGKSIAIAGARHTMGGHTITKDGIVLNMLPFHQLKLDEDKKILRAGAGARWSEIVPFLDARGLSVLVMQSNNDFSVGGSLSANCHGWQVNRPPIASTVESFRLMRADGNIVRCSRSENAELFRLVLGGYGLFGVILDADLYVVPNERYGPKGVVLASSKYVEEFKRTVSDDVPMAYGRLCLVPGEKFLSEAILTTFHREPSLASQIPAIHNPPSAALQRLIFRGQIGSDAGKDVRWKAEVMNSKAAPATYTSRNQQFNESAAVFQEQGDDRTDIIHEYFIPEANFEAFLTKARTIIPRYKSDLLNVTIRNVLEDKDAVMRYADCDMFCFVMLFNIPRTTSGDDEMSKVTRELIDAALSCKGRYYLPYRAHATREQFRAAYPQGAQFFERKRFYDPQGIFRNEFYENYGH